MVSTTYNGLQSSLKSLRNSSGHIQASALISTEGLIIASDMPANFDEDVISAMAAAIISIGEQITNELDRGKLKQVYIKGKMGYVLLNSLGNEAVLIALIDSSAKLGLIMFNMTKTSEEIKNSLFQPA